PSPDGAVAANGIGSGSPTSRSGNQVGPSTEVTPGHLAASRGPEVSGSTAVSASGSRPGAGPAPSPSSAMISVASSGGLTAMVRSPLVRKMLEVVLADPIMLTP